MRTTTTQPSTETSFMVGLPTLTPTTDKQLTVLPKAPLPEEDLTRVRDLMHSAGRDFAAITRGKGDYEKSATLHTVSERLNRRGTFRWVTGLAAGAGVVGGFIAAMATRDVHLWALGAGVGCAVTPALLGMRVVAKHRIEAAAKKLIPLAGRLADMVTRFQNAGGNEKVLLGTTLGQWLDDMARHHALKPVTRHALEEVGRVMAQLPADERKRMEQLKTLVGVLDSAGPVTREVVRNLTSACSTFNGSERFTLTRAAIAIMEERPADYDGEHALFDARLANDRAEEAYNTAQAAKAAQALIAPTATAAAL